MLIAAWHLRQLATHAPHAVALQQQPNSNDAFEPYPQRVPHGLSPEQLSLSTPRRPARPGSSQPGKVMGILQLRIANSERPRMCEEHLHQRQAGNPRRGGRRGR